MKSTRLEQAIVILNARQMRDETKSHLSGIDARALLIVTLAYLVAMLSVPVSHTDMIIWFAVYPIVSAPLAHVAYERLCVNSLYILPLLAFIGIFNPLYDKTPAFAIGGLTVSQGWISFISILLRGLLSVQALLLLIRVAGFNNICEAMRRLKVPGVIVTQLLMVYRYLTVLLQEGLSMKRARVARSGVRISLSISGWGVLVGQLLLRTLERSRQINMAMKARGFNGTLPMEPQSQWSTADTVYCIVWIPIFIIFRYCNISTLLLTLINYNQ